MGQDVAKMGLRWAKMGQDEAKIGPDEAKMRPRLGQDEPRWSQDGVKRCKARAYVGGSLAHLARKLLSSKMVFRLGESPIFGLGRAKIRPR